MQCKTAILVELRNKKTLTGVKNPRSLAIVEDCAFQCSLQLVAGAPHVWLSVVRLHISQLTVTYGYPSYAAIPLPCYMY